MRRYRLTKKKKPPVWAEAERVLQVLSEIDAARADLRWYDDEMWAVLTRSARIRRAWAEFLSSGGVTADDWVNYLRVGARRGCVRSEGHLRLVVDNPTSSRRSRRPRTRTGDSAA
jgi:hypothetical protein